MPLLHSIQYYHFHDKININIQFSTITVAGSNSDIVRIKLESINVCYKLKGNNIDDTDEPIIWWIKAMMLFACSVLDCWTRGYGFD